MKKIETNENAEKKNQVAVVAKLFAWYINPVIYVLFSVLYFISGIYYWTNVNYKKTYMLWIFLF